MSSPVGFSVFIEIMMIGLSTLLLTQPKFFFRLASPKMTRVLTWVGLIVLVLTFCWSVVLGIVFAMNDMTFRL